MKNDNSDNKGLTQAEISKFKKLLLAKRNEILGDVISMEDEALRGEKNNLSNMPIHMADVGTDSYDQEFTLGLMDSERKLMKEIDEALGRIENGTYAICEGSGKPIPKSRLKAIPWAKYCVEYASMLEKGLGKKDLSLPERRYDYGEDEEDDNSRDTFRESCDMRKIDKGFILPSAAYALKRSQMRFYKTCNKKPEVGDIVYGQICLIGQHSSLENASGRIHMIHDGTKAIFVFGNRYAPDYYEGIVPDKAMTEVDLLARSGMIGMVKTKNAMKKDPSKIRILGHVCDESGNVLNTIKFPLIKPKTKTKKRPRAKMILVCGTSMNSGKSMAAAACCWALTSMGYNVRASKVTGTASLKDILHMNDAGASHYADFTCLGYPATYMLPEEDLLRIFNQLDLKYANNPKNFWVVELADGIIQRETRMLLESEQVRSRIHKLIFCASDAFGAIGGLNILKNLDLTPDALSGICSSSPLHIRELKEFTNIPVFNSAEPDRKSLPEILCRPAKHNIKSKIAVDKQQSKLSDSLD